MSTDVPCFECYQIVVALLLKLLVALLRRRYLVIPFPHEVLALRAPSTARRSAASLPMLLECPFIHSKSVPALSFCRSSILLRMFSTRSLFSTAFPAAVFHPFFFQFLYQLVTQSMAYLLSVIMLASLLRGTISRARRIAVSSAR